jgi:hypothetical protein
MLGYLDTKRQLSACQKCAGFLTGMNQPPPELEQYAHFISFRLSDSRYFF